MRFLGHRFDRSLEVFTLLASLGLAFFGPRTGLADEGVLIALPQGIYVRADAYPAMVSIGAETVHVTTPTGSVAVPIFAWTTPLLAEAEPCALDARRVGNDIYVHAAGLYCIGVPAIDELPALPLPVPSPMLDFSLGTRHDAVRIVIDAGHGGKDSGALGVSTAVEKEIALAVALALRDRLQRETGFEVFLTREDDRYLPLKQRADIANSVRADLFVSIHCNSGRRVGARGVEIYIPGRRASDEETRRLAAVENGDEDDSFVPTGVNAVLEELALADQLQHSARAADRMLFNMTQGLASENRGVKQAPFWVLLGANMPALLIEIGFVTNPDESLLLTVPRYQAFMADTMAKALLELQPVLLSRRRNTHAPIINSRGEGITPSQTRTELAPPR